MFIPFISGRNFGKYNKTHINLSRRLWLRAVKQDLREFKCSKGGVKLWHLPLVIEDSKSNVRPILVLHHKRNTSIPRGVSLSSNLFATGEGNCASKIGRIYEGERINAHGSVCVSRVTSPVGSRKLWKRFGLEIWLADECIFSAQILLEGTFPQCCSYPSGCL